MSKYDAYINYDYQGSLSHKHMPISDRAAQFIPFAALTGYEEAIFEKARITDQKRELEENELEKLDAMIMELANKRGTKVRITYFKEDEVKSGGAYITDVLTLKKVDYNYHMLEFKDHESISVENIYAITEMKED